MDSSPVKLAETLIDWYWSHGCKRTDRFALPRSTWLDRLYDVRSTLADVEASQRNKKPSMALWGPSQTGKSTLISSYVDSGADEIGNDSGLHWPEGEPARFVVKDPDADAIVLNPYHFGADASGCVSRFVLHDEIPDPMHPVEVRLTTPMQIMHALALGYLSECNVLNQDGETTYFKAEEFSKRLADFARKTKSGDARRASYDAVHPFVDLLETLIFSELPRYQNLHPAWKSLRRELLECPALSADIQNVYDFAAEVLWDNRPVLTNHFQKFIEHAAKLSQAWQDKPVFCSLRVAASLLDISACSRVSQPQSPADHLFRQQVLSIGYEIGTDSVRISLAHPTKLVQNDEEFGLLQGLVRELVIPIRRGAQRQEGSAFYRFLEVANLLDFPGVARAGQNTKETRLDVRSFNDENRIKVFTEILKRGKTASIVMSYARNLGIDGFSILTRWGDFPAQPGQLLTGILTWWKHFDPTFDPHSTSRRSPLPFNLVLTFCSDLVHDVMQGGIGAGLAQPFQMLEKLTPISHPAVVSHTLATNYPQFKTAKIDGTPEAVQDAGRKIEEDPAFCRQFHSPASRSSFHAMLENGGTDYLFCQLRHQANDSERQQLLEDRRSKSSRILCELLGEAMPSDAGSTAQRQKDLEEWKRSIEIALANCGDEDSVTELSVRLRSLLNVDDEILDPVPLNLAGNGNKNRPTVAFLEKQFQLWRSDAARRDNQLTACGIRDAAQLNRLLHYLVETVPISHFSVWVLRYFGRLTSEQEARHARRFLATNMASMLLLGPSDDHQRTHCGSDEIQRQLAGYTESETSIRFRCENSPHHRAFIQPFLNRLQKLAETESADARPRQPGDTELESIHSMFIDVCPL